MLAVARSDERTVRAGQGPWLIWLILIVQTVLFVAVSRQPAPLHPDAVVFMQLGRYWHDGQWSLAITGYWSPMLTWLIAAGLFVVADVERAAQIAMCISAAVYFLGCTALVRSMPLAGVPKWFVYLICSLFVLDRSLLLFTDLLMSGILFFATAQMLNRRWFTSWKSQLMAGVLIGLSCLAKLAALPIGLLMIGMFSWRWHALLGARLRTAVQCVVVTVGGAALIFGPWAVVISTKLGRPTLGTSARLAHSLAGPKSQWPIFGQHPLQPGRIISWEEPSDWDQGNWSPLESWSSALDQLEIVERNILHWWQIFLRMDYFALGVFAALIAFWWQRPEMLRVRKERWRWAIIPIACNLLPYLPVLSNSKRYYFFMFPFLVIAACGCLHWLVWDAKKNSLPRFLLVLAITATAIARILTSDYLPGDFRLVTVPSIPLAIILLIIWIVRRPWLTPLRMHWIALTLAFASLALVNAVHIAFLAVRNHHSDTACRRVAANLTELGLRQPLAATPAAHDYESPLAFLLQQPLVFTATNPSTAADELVASKARLVIALRDDPSDKITEALSSDPRFENLDSKLFHGQPVSTTDMPIHIFAIRNETK